MNDSRSLVMSAELLEKNIPDRQPVWTLLTIPIGIDN